MNFLEKEDRFSQDVIKVLGVKRNLKDDTLYVQTKELSSNKVTKREILKVTAGIFDPLGYYPQLY